MVEFNDIVIKHGSDLFIQFSLSNNKFIDSNLAIYHKNETIFTGILNSSFFVHRFKPVEEERYNFKIILQKNRKKYEFEVSVIQLKKDERYLICDIDFTLAKTNMFLFLTKNLIHFKKLKNSSETLQKLSENMKIIYLTWRPNKHTKTTKDWLVKNHFPLGAMIGRGRDNLYNAMAFKSKQIGDIAKISKNGVGIGDLKSDIDAYLDNNLVAIRINKKFLEKKTSNYSFNNGYYSVNSWSAISNIFKNILKN